MPKQRAVLPAAALVIASILWGTNTTLIKLGVASIPVPIFMSIRFLIAALVMLPFAVRTWKPLKQNEYLLLILSSLFYITLSALALNIGLSKTTASNAAIIWVLEPIILLVLSASFLKERITARMFIGISIALAGSLVIIGKPWHGDLLGTELTGNLLIVLSVFCQTISTLLCKPLAKKVSVYQMTFMNIFPGIVPVAIYAATQLHSWHIASTTSKSFYALVYSTIAVIIANFLFFYALQYKKAQSTGVYQYLDPVATIITAWLLLHERPSLGFGLGAILVLGGIVLAEFSKFHKSDRLVASKRSRPA